MSQKLFSRLQKKARRRGRLQVCNEKTSVRLADGSVSKKPCKSVWLSVRPQHLARPVRIKFFIVSGGINLLGRWAICQLWPEHYAEFKRAVCVPREHRSSVIPEEIGDQCVATPTGSLSTPQQGDGADMVECVATLVVNVYVYKLPSVVRDMSSSHVGAEIAQWDS